MYERRVPNIGTNFYEEQEEDVSKRRNGGTGENEDRWSICKAELGRDLISLRSLSSTSVPPPFSLFPRSCCHGILNDVTWIRHDQDKVLEAKWENGQRPFRIGMKKGEKEREREREREREDKSKRSLIIQEYTPCISAGQSEISKIHMD